ncbi:MAG: DUF2249 domain-containing protein [Nostocoides sp.]
MEHRTDLPVTEAPHACGCQDHDHGDPELDVRTIPHAIRHATVFGALSAIPAGGSLIIVAPHNPKPLLAQIAEREGPVTVTYLDEGPERWRLKITRA